MLAVQNFSSLTMKWKATYRAHLMLALAFWLTAVICHAQSGWSATRIMAPRAGSNGHLVLIILATILTSSARTQVLPWQAAVSLRLQMVDTPGAKLISSRRQNSMALRLSFTVSGLMARSEVG